MDVENALKEQIEDMLEDEAEELEVDLTESGGMLLQAGGIVLLMSSQVPKWCGIISDSTLKLVGHYNDHSKVGSLPFKRTEEIVLESEKPLDDKALSFVGTRYVFLPSVRMDFDVEIEFSRPKTLQSNVHYYFPFESNQDHEALRELHDSNKKRGLEAQNSPSASSKSA